MKCPHCGADCDKVTDSRTSQDASFIRRRRKCLKCGTRFTTYERVELHLPLVVKKDGSREAFDRRKIERGLLSACQKRKISSDKLSGLIDSVVTELERDTIEEVPSEHIGELIMERLRGLDDVAYVRFASVYSAFDDVRQFLAAVRDVAPVRKRPARTKPDGNK